MPPRLDPNDAKAVVGILVGETFAYACEVYSRMLELGRSAAVRRELLSQAENGLSLPDDRVVASEHQHSPCCRRRPKWMEGNSAELQTSSPETGHFDEPGVTLLAYHSLRPDRSRRSAVPTRTGGALRAWRSRFTPFPGHSLGPSGALKTCHTFRAGWPGSTLDTCLAFGPRWSWRPLRANRTLGTSNPLGTGRTL
jgi:hypothetical protein